MPLPKAIRSRVPDRIRDDPSLRALALGLGFIPPRVMHTPAEARLLSALARGRRCVVEIGVYEGSSALLFVGALERGAELHLIDPFTDESQTALFPGWRGNAVATRLVVGRAVGSNGPRIVWHVRRSQEVGRAWTGPEVDLVFIDGDHDPPACREDWEVWHPHVRVGGAVAFHDARIARPGGEGSSPGPSQVVDQLLREPPVGWRLAHEVDTLVVLERTD